MWHSSAAPLPGWPSDPVSLRGFALKAIQGVGDASRGEWTEWTGVAYHVRRRLSEAEQQQVGAVMDIRGTPEAAKRIARVLKYVMCSPRAMQVVAMELAEQ